MGEVKKPRCRQAEKNVEPIPYILESVIKALAAPRKEELDASNEKEDLS